MDEGSGSQSNKEENSGEGVTKSVDKTVCPSPQSLLGVDPMASKMLDKCSVTELHLQTQTVTLLFTNELLPLQSAFSLTHSMTRRIFYNLFAFEALAFIRQSMTVFG